MTMELTKEEIEKDLRDTRTDIENLLLIIRGLSGFIQQCGDENRSSFRTDLFTYEGLLQQARRLATAIENKLTLQ